jgi:hypothetical protein
MAKSGNDSVAKAEAMLVGQIIRTEQQLADEYRESVRDVYRKRILQWKWELSGINPEHPLVRPPPPPPAATTDPASRIRRDIGKALGVWQNEENTSHVRALALIRLAELQAELYTADGTPAAISVEAAHDYFNSVVAAERQLIASPPPPMSHMANSTGKFQRRVLERETQLVSDPTDAAVQARRRNFAVAAAQAQYVPTSAGKRADDLIPNPISRGAANYNITSRNPVYQTEPTDLTGRGTAR